MFYSTEELKGIGFKYCGDNVSVSKLVSIYNPEVISIGSNSRIDDFCVLSGGAGITVGEHVHISCFTGLYGGGGIKIGDFCGLSSRVAVYSVSDDFSGRSMTNSTIPEKYRPFLKRAFIFLDPHTIIGTGSTILPGVRLCMGCAVYAHSLVTESFDPLSIIAGIPAKKIKDREKDFMTYSPK